MTDKILIVEDEKNLQLLYQMKLEAEGFKVTTANNCDRALEKLNKEPVDLVMLDLDVQSGAGLDYLQQFVSTKRDVKVMIVTDSGGYHWDFRAWIADGCFEKSSDLKQLGHAVEQVLHSGQQIP